MSLGDWFRAVKRGDYSTVSNMLAEHPEFLNLTNVEEDEPITALHIAVCRSHEIVALLLTYPDININLITKENWSPFGWSISYDIKTFTLLIEDPRTVLATDIMRPFLHIMERDLYHVLEMWIFTGREMDHYDLRWTKEEVERRGNKTMALYLDFLDNPTEVRDRIRAKHPSAIKPARLFALVIFFCDDLFQLKNSEKRITQFFSIMKRLPMEIQMLICNRCAGLSCDLIPSSQRELAFRNLVLFLHEEK